MNDQLSVKGVVTCQNHGLAVVHSESHKSVRNQPVRLELTVLANSYHFCVQYPSDSL